MCMSNRLAKRQVKRVVVEPLQVFVDAKKGTTGDVDTVVRPV